MYEDRSTSDVHEVALDGIFVQIGLLPNTEWLRDTVELTARGEVVVDYEMIPPDKPAEWPAIKPNTAGLQRFVYAYMHDYMRKVSDHVSIGRAYRRDRETPNCFLLCREG